MPAAPASTTIAATAGTSGERLTRIPLGRTGPGSGPRSGRRPPAIADGDAAVVVLGDPLGDREPEARPADRRAGCPPEPIEHALAVLGPDARARVLDRHAGAIAGRPHDDTHRAAARTVPDRVVDEDHHELSEPG